ncbi:MAG: PilZ domain-containing protein [Myxococcota bacterium]|nr:PilZ domain-containing protein [Myxococcota bacterium]
MSWFKKLFQKNKDEGPGRRRRERTNTKIPFALEVGSHRFIGNSLDLSMSGALLQVEEGTELSDKLAKQQGVLRLLFPNGEFTANCTLIRVDWSAIAVNFHDLPGSPNEETLFTYLETQLGDIW